MPSLLSCAQQLDPRDRRLDVATLTTDGTGIVTGEHGPDGAPILIVRRSATSFSALSTQCTHEGCPVNPPAGGVITCPCHGSQYDLEGHVIHGPALYSLASYPVTFDRKAQQVTVRVEGGPR